MWGMFGRFLKWVIPLISRNAEPLLKQAATAEGKEALDSVANIAKGALIGRPIKKTLKENESQKLIIKKQKLTMH